MRARSIPVLVLAFLLASCGGDEAFFSTLTTSTTSSLPTTTLPVETITTTAPVETTTTSTTVPPVTAWGWVRLDDTAFGMEAEGYHAGSGSPPYPAVGA